MILEPHSLRSINGIDLEPQMFPHKIELPISVISSIILPCAVLHLRLYYGQRVITLCVRVSLHRSHIITQVAKSRFKASIILPPLSLTRELICSHGD